MNVRIGYYDVDIVARADIEPDTEHDTLALLTRISVVYDDAARFLEREGYNALAEECRRDSNSIWDRVKEVRNDDV